MRKSLQVGLRTKLTLLILVVALLPMALFGFLSYLQSRDALTTATLNNLTSLANAQEKRIEERIASDQRRLAFASAGIPELVAVGNAGAITTNLRRAQQTIPELTEIAVLDTEGVVIASTNTATIGQNRQSTLYFKSATEGLLRPEVFRGADGKLNKHLAGPLKTGDQVQGVLVITYPAAIIASVSADTNGLGETGEYVLVTREPESGDAINIGPLRFDGEAALKGRTAKGDRDRPATYALEGRDETFTNLKDYRGKNVLTATRHIDGFDWGLYAKIDQKEAYRPIADLRLALLLIGLALGALMILVVTEVARSIATPLVRLTRMTAKIGSGKLAERASVRSTDELGRLSGSINQMAERLSKSQQALHQRVEERSAMAEKVSSRNRELRNALSRLSRTREKVQHQALHDALTGLPNRTLFNDRLQVAIAHANRNKSKVAILFFDLNRFKSINDTLGHLIGDEVLRAVADRLPGCVRNEDTVARFGGDEFIIIVGDVKSEKAVLKAAEKVYKCIRKPFTIRRKDYHLDATIGVAVYPDHGKDAPTLIRNADTALYRAKASRGRRAFKVYDETMSSRASKKMELENDLRQAIKEKRFEVHYQPIVRPDGSILMGEALVRWNHPRLGLIYPDEFIGYAEEMGFLDEIGEQVFTAACKEAGNWKRSGHGMCVAVNLSAYQFVQPNLIPMIKRAARAGGLPLKKLEVEITESVAVQNLELTTRTLRALRKLGVSIALDDFGTGHSSLQYLRELPIDKIKIDGSFVRNALTDQRDFTLIMAIIAIAKSHNMSVIAEGVETKELWNRFSKLGLHGLQGYYFSRAVPGSDFRRLLRKNTKEDFAAAARKRRTRKPK